MRQLKLTILFLALSQLLSAQIVFNRIIEDTISHITSGVTIVDSGYLLLTGSYNNYMLRTYAIRYLNSEGDIQWKRTSNDSLNILYEGFDNLKRANGFSHLSGEKYDITTGEKSVYLIKFDENFNQIFQKSYLNQDIFIAAFNQLYFDSYFYITGQIKIESSQRNKLLLIKTDSDGNMIWSKIFGLQYEGGGHIISDFENNILIGGLTKSYSYNYIYNMWYLIKTDTAGNLIWEKSYGKNNLHNSDIKCLIETQDSNILACGLYPITKYGGGEGEYQWDGCLRKIDQNGELVWERLYRNYSKIESPDMIHLECSLSEIIQKENNLYLLGNNRDHRGASNGYLQKISDSGDICWQRNYYAIDTNTSYQWLVSGQNTIDGGFIMAGYGNTYGTHGYDPPQQAWLVKTDSLGMDGLCNIEPDELNIDIEIPEIPEGICMNDTMEVYVYIAGKSAPYTIEFNTGQIIDSIYYPPCFVPVEIGLTDIHLEWGGEYYFEDTITEATLSNHEWGQCIVKKVQFYTPSTWGPQDLYITITDAYGESKTITKEVFPVECSTYNELSENIDLKIYPNPVKDKLYIDIPEDIILQKAEIYNSIGQLVKTINLHNNNNIVDVSELTPGNYILHINTEKETYNLSFEK